ncbi:hypothetical protein [Brevibacillus laterosporus]|uniref:Uncharacterized protein n=1 Tax=Brevibacillus laterosporus TaxID=1465 RepID=A0AAP3G8W7_BRELA|nr:hypothetical protein [Brevibacillus laterosporus]MCR8981828.1 hypothetical protein [Brevibacillus laterosporus]MCZ0808983.1 hypothetical protein [Brevibacillus laterosporus]MCZ0827389.1 hypothetical protein [Brevibacillus laterosporus]MCZ0853006.1 hypothetical protein [Brevibacillus laterosporus]
MKIIESFINQDINKLSSKKIDLCLSLFTYIDWDCHVRFSTIERLASEIGTTVKYVKEMMNELKRDGVLSCHPNNPDLVRFELASDNLEWERGDRYCKPFFFFDSPEFKRLKVNAKRIILKAALQLSIQSSSQNTTVVMEKEAFFSRKQYHLHKLPLDNERFSLSIREINAKLSGIVDVQVHKSVETKKEFVVFNFVPEILNQFYTIERERSLLEDTFTCYGVVKNLSPETYQGILATAKGFINSLVKESELLLLKKYSIQVTSYSKAEEELLKQKRTVRYLARSIYDEAVRYLASSLNSFELELNTPDAISAYFRGILHNISLEKMTENAKEIDRYHSFAMSFNSLPDYKEGKSKYEYLKKLGLEGFNIIDQDTIFYATKRYQFIFDLLIGVCHKWFESKITQTLVNFSGYDMFDLPGQRKASISKEDARRKLTDLRNKEINKLEEIEKEVKEEKHPYQFHEVTLNLLEAYKKTIEFSYAHIYKKVS